MLQQGTTELLKCAQGEGGDCSRSSRKVCVQAGTSMLALQGGYAGGMEGEGCTS